ncbi:MAG TPA: FAD-binding oxidoreductase [Chitinophagales bacterium]|nr:FAD-binding oxidoreductase [Chitinophagales bacterium]
MPKYVWYKGKVVNIIDETHNIKRFFIQIPEVKSFDFKPGQFVMLDLPINSKVTYRSYSIASPPDRGNVIELIIVLNETGLGTPYLFSQVRVGSELTVSSALGKFLLPEKIEKDICFICTGVGIAPFRSMYLDIFNKNIPHRNLYLVFGTRYMTDLCYPHELYELDRTHNSFHYLPTLSRESGDKWSGRTGYVHSVYKELFSDLRPAYFYICGWKNMIFEARDNLLAMGYQKSQIKYELYD